ncbi:MAG TPA: glycosyltransferase [Terriglobales bacterium]
MRVLLLGPYPPPHGGVETNLVAIRSFLLQRGISCAVINITRHRKTEGDGVYYPAGAFELLRLLFRLDYDVLHLHVGGMLSQRVLRLALTCTSVPRKKTVFTFHSGGYPSTPKAQLTGSHSFDGFVLRRFDRLIAVNQEIADLFLRLGVARERTRIIAPHAFSGGEDYMGELTEPLAGFIARHQPVLISAGQLEPEYDLKVQIEALGQLLLNQPNAGLVLLGRGSLEEELRGFIQAKPFSQHILLGGDVPHAVTMRAIYRSDAMLRTTLYDGDAISVREALYLGTPVIATDNDMRPSGVRLVPISDVNALSVAVSETLALSAGRPRETGIPDDTNLQAVLDLYRQLVPDLNDSDGQP